MFYKTLLLTHILGATIGLLAGYLAIWLRKGSGLHAAAGSVFGVSMLAMGSSAAYIATFIHPVGINVMAGSLTCYLVGTSWYAARRRRAETSNYDSLGALFGFGIAALGLVYAFQAATSATGKKHGMPAGGYIVFGAVALLCAINDVRMIRRGGVTGAPRILRHLWRMSLALMLATLSLYPGQARLFPMWLRETNLLFVPHVLLLGTMLLYGVRTRRRRRAEARPAAAAMPPPEAIAA